MAKVDLDAKGLKCPVPTLKMTNLLMQKQVQGGDVLEVVADCPTFPDDVKAFCARFKKVLIFMREEAGGIRRCQIQI